jgi:hypothetical protein
MDKEDKTKEKELKLIFDNFYRIGPTLCDALSRSITQIGPVRVLTGEHLKMLPYKDVLGEKYADMIDAGKAHEVAYGLSLANILRVPKSPFEHMNQRIYPDMMSRLLEYDDHRKAIVDALIAGTHSGDTELIASDSLIWYITQALIYPAKDLARDREYLQEAKVKTAKKKLAIAEKVFDRIPETLTTDPELKMHISNLINYYHKLNKKKTNEEAITSLLVGAFCATSCILDDRDKLIDTDKISSTLTMLYYIMAYCTLYKKAIPKWAIFIQCIRCVYVFMRVLHSDAVIAASVPPEEI